MEKKLKRMGREALLELLIEVQTENEELRAQIAATENEYKALLKRAEEEMEELRSQTANKTAERGEFEKVAIRALREAGAFEAVAKAAAMFQAEMQGNTAGDVQKADSQDSENAALGRSRRRRLLTDSAERVSEI